MSSRFRRFNFLKMGSVCAIYLLLDGIHLVCCIHSISYFQFEIDNSLSRLMLDLNEFMNFIRVNIYV